MIKAVKGMRDLLPPSTAVWNHVEAAAREVFRVYNYHEIRTPIVEETALFVRGVGEDTDVVSKEMYTFEDRDDTSLTLRPEATASVMRAYIEHRLDQIPGVKKYYYIGPMFRRERPQKGRFRQFFQIGAEAIGSESPIVDAEVIEMVIEVLKKRGHRRISRRAEFDRRWELPPCIPGTAARKTERRRLADVRRLPAPRGHESAARAGLQGSCRTSRSSNRCLRLPIIYAVPARNHFAEVRAHLDARGIEYEVKPRMVRGLDYYMRTTFEITHGSLGSAELRSGRRKIRRAGGIVGFASAGSGNRIFDRRRPAGDGRRKKRIRMNMIRRSTCFWRRWARQRNCTRARSRQNCAKLEFRWSGQPIEN